MRPTHADVLKAIKGIPSDEGFLIVDGTDSELRKLAERPALPGKAASMIVLGGPPGDLGPARKPPHRKPQAFASKPSRTPRAAQKTGPTPDPVPATTAPTELPAAPSTTEARKNAPVSGVSESREESS